MTEHALEQPRRRAAPTVDGRRTTLTLPADLSLRVAAAAEHAGLSENAMLIEFALRGAALFEAEVDRLATVERRARLVRSVTADPDGPFPTDDEALAAARLVREE